MTRRTSLAAIFASSAFAQVNEKSAVLQALEDFLNGWNSRDPARYADALHFPHLILDDGRFNEYPSRDQFVAKGKSLWDSAPKEWDHTCGSSGKSYSASATRCMLLELGREKIRLGEQSIPPMCSMLSSSERGAGRFSRVREAAGLDDFFDRRKRDSPTGKISAR
jgi:hypothetical protein